MYYTPAISIPGKLAHVTLEKARNSAKADKSYVMDDDFEIIERYDSTDAIKEYMRKHEDTNE